MADDEESRAAAYRASLVRRNAYLVRMNGTMKGDSAALVAFTARWEAMRRWLAERQQR